MAPGEPPAQGCRPSIAYHPTHNFAVVVNHKEHEINAYPSEPQLSIGANVAAQLPGWR